MSGARVDVIPLHQDGSECEHAMRPSGKPRAPDSGCTGRARYRAVCRGEGCGWEYEYGLRTVVEDEVRLHRGRCTAPRPARRPAAAGSGKGGS